MHVFVAASSAFAWCAPPSDNIPLIRLRSTRTFKVKHSDDCRVTGADEGDVCELYDEHDASREVAEVWRCEDGNFVRRSVLYQRRECTGALINNEWQFSFEGCADLCDGKPACSGFSWRAALFGQVGRCKLYGGFVSTRNSNQNTVCALSQAYLTHYPTSVPTLLPSTFPTRYPTAFPTHFPTAFPTPYPTSLSVPYNNYNTSVSAGSASGDDRDAKTSGRLASFFQDCGKNTMCSAVTAAVGVFLLCSVCFCFCWWPCKPEPATKRQRHRQQQQQLSMGTNTIPVAVPFGERDRLSLPPAERDAPIPMGLPVTATGQQQPSHNSERVGLPAAAVVTAIAPAILPPPPVQSGRIESHLAVVPRQDPSPPSPPAPAPAPAPAGPPLAQAHACTTLSVEGGRHRGFSGDDGLV